MDQALLATKECRYGRMTYLRTDTYIGRSLELYGEWCEGEIILFRRLLQTGHVAIDVGANVGTHTLALAALVGSSGQVYAFEPQDVIYELLCNNVAANGLANVTSKLAAVGATNSICHIPRIDYATQNNFGAVSVGEGDVEVPMVTIDSLELPKLNLIKIDAEGAEGDVLRGAAATLRRLRPIVYVENNNPKTARELVELVRSVGYRMWWHIVVRYNDMNFAGNARNVWPDDAEPNMVCLPAEAPPPPWPFREVGDGSEMVRPGQ